MPTYAGFLLFLQNVVGLTTAQISYNGGLGILQMAYNVALGLTNQYLLCTPVPPPQGVAGGTTLYTLAVYNLGADRVINYGQDEPDAPNVPGSQPPTPFFQWTRSQLNINAFTSGVISGAHDESTGSTLVVPEAFKNLTLSDLNNLQTPWGRAYLGITQSVGPEAWGIS